MKISAYIITFNEEKHIKGCLESLLFCDEIVILDSGSVDKTCDIIKTFTKKEKNIQVKLKNFPFKGFVDQKNLAIKHTSNDWVFNLDADERVSDELLTSILEIKKIPDEQLDQEISGYSMNRRNFYIDTWVRYSGWYPDRKIRIVNKKSGKWSGRQLHETIELLKGKSHHLNGDILHYTFESVSDHLQKIDKYTTIAASEYVEKSKQISIFMTILKSVTTFCRSYFFKLGILDGKTGFIIAIMSAYHTWLKYLKLWYINKHKT
jgi:glycosyltransferase involved in cell wall biosynthesis